MIEISSHFTADEFVVSAQFPSLAAQISLSDEDLQKLHYLCLFGLEPLREHFQAPIYILSGKRSPELNLKVGGSVNSQHMLCEAADFEMPSVDCMAVYLWLHASLKWCGQLFCYPTKRFVHMALPRRGVAPNHGLK